MSVTLINHTGNDAAIARAARVSLGADVEHTPEEDAGLIRYLVKHSHTSPLEHTQLTYHVEAPIFVAREFMRHRMMSYNEISGRYGKLPAVFWYPDKDRPIRPAGTPARPVFTPDPTLVAAATSALAEAYSAADRAYQQMLEAGVPTEVARAALPVGLYTRWYVTCNVHALLRFLQLRTPGTSYPQYEIAQVAAQMEDLATPLFPAVFEAWNERGRTL